jgi:hypothetical protein
MGWLNLFERFHATVTRPWWMHLFAAFTRCLLAVGFIPPSIVKIMHQPFTSLPESSTVGYFFNALLKTGFYYDFIGWCQLTAAILLLIPQASHIGAFLFLPIIANIAVLTISVGFTGTWIITSFMFLAALFLTLWEYDRLKPAFFYRREKRSRRFRYQFIAIPAFFGLGGAVLGFLLWLAGEANASNSLRIGGILVAIGLVFGIFVAIHYWFMPVGKLKNPDQVPSDLDR